MVARTVTKRDLSSINKWLKRHGVPPSTWSDLPKIGFIIPGVAAGFIRDCENGIGMVDNFVTNSLCSKLTRNVALDTILEQLKKQPFRYNIVATADAGLGFRFQKHNFKYAPLMWLYREK